jgi:hypothetical protein
MDRRNDPAEPLPLVPSDPVPLVRAPSLRESWFDTHREDSVSRPSISSELDVRDSLIFGTSRNSSTLCGAFIGLVAASAMIATAMFASHADVARILGGAFTRYASGWESTAGLAAFSVIGMLLGAGFARATKHVERMLPVAIFGIVFSPIVWLALHVFVLARFAPAVAAALPVGALVMGAAVAGLFLSLVVPLRGHTVRARPERVSIS